MNPRLLLPVLIWLASLASLCADEARWNVTAECQMVTLPQKAALALLPELLEEAKIDAAFARLQEMIAKGEAQAMANLIAKGHPGEKKATAESTEEVRYATQFEPPDLPPGLVEKPDILDHWPRFNPMPTEIDTRKVGTTLELEVQVDGDAPLISVDCTATHERLLRMNKLDTGRLPNGEHLFIEQPLFHMLKTTSSLFLRSGQRVLLGVHKLSEPADTWELFFLRVSAVKVP